MGKKKIIIIVIAVLILLLICGTIIGGGDDATTSDSSSSASDSSSTSEEPSTVFSIGDTISYEDVEYIISDVETFTSREYETAADGKEYVMLNVSITNNSDEQISYNSWDWQMSNSQGQLDDTALVIFDSDTSLTSGELLPGGATSGTLVFEEPIDDSALTLYFMGNIFSEDPAFTVVITE